MSKKDLVSVIVTTKNEQDVIGRLITSLKKQSYQNIEIILVDNFSQDQTVKIAKKEKVVVYQYGPERSAQRNFGAKVSKGNFLFFLDADMELTDGVINEAVKKIKVNPQIGGIIIPEVSKAENFWGQVKAFERSFYNLSGDEYTDAARFFKRELIKRVGGYDETITGPEDWDLPERIKKLGFKIERIKTVIYHYERISSPYQLARKKYYYGLKSSRYLSKNKISAIGPKTIYLLRPVFYKNWKKLLSNPGLSIAMFFLLTVEQIAGGLGYIRGLLDE